MKLDFEVKLDERAKGFCCPVCLMKINIREHIIHAHTGVGFSVKKVEAKDGFDSYYLMRKVAGVEPVAIAACRIPQCKSLHKETKNDKTSN